jgi:hypothetical protein
MNLIPKKGQKPGTRGYIIPAPYNVNASEYNDSYLLFRHLQQQGYH